MIDDISNKRATEIISLSQYFKIDHENTILIYIPTTIFPFQTSDQATKLNPISKAGRTKSLYFLDLFYP